MLGATQAQLFNTSKVGGTAPTYDADGNQISAGSDGTTQITGFKPYQPYSSNVNDYFAGPSPMMQQSYQGMANMQVAPQVAEGSQMANQGGAGLMASAVPAMGMAGQAAMSGRNYQNMATDPNAISSYMSPYMQNVVNYQKGQALRDFQMGQPMMARQAVGQGAFGGNRLALQQAEAQRGLMSQLQGIEATGSQNAFQNAQQAQQFGSTLGLQGLQTGLQGIGTAQAGLTGGLNAANTLGTLGQNQYGQQMGILQGQNQFGLQQQQQEQAKINQSISDYATQQQYPMLQLGLMSNMLRGLPMQSQTTQMYQAQPSALQQGVGTLGALGSLYGSGAFGKKEGGIIGYKYGGAIAEPKLAGMAQNLSAQQLQQRLKDPELDSGERQIFADALADKSREKARYAGIAAAGGGLFESQGYAGGGILAFTDEGEVKDPEKLAEKINLIGSQLDAVNKEAGASMGPGSKQKAFAPEKVKDYENLKKRQSELKTEYSDLMGKAGLDKPAVGYRSGVAPTTLYPNSTEQALLGDKPPAAAPAQPTAGELQAFDDATARFVAEQKAKAGPAAASEGAAAPGARAPGGGAAPAPAQANNLAALLKERQALGPQGVAGADFEEFLKGRLGDSSKRLSQAQGLAAAKAFAEFGSTAAPGGIGQAISRGLGTYAEGYGKATSAEDAITLEAQKMQKDLDVARRAEARGDVEGAQKAYDSAADRQNRIQTAQIQAAASMAGHGATQKTQDAAIERIMKDKGVGYTEALQIYKRAGLNVENTDITRAKAALAEITNQLMFMKKDDPARAALLQQRDQLTQALVSGGGGGNTGGGGNLVQNKDGSFNYVPK